MKNVVITILAMLVLGLGGFLVYDKLLSNEKTQNNNEPSEEYTLMDKNNESIKFLYQAAKGLRPNDKVYTTSLKAEDRSQRDKFCSAIELTNGRIALMDPTSTEDVYAVFEEKLKNTYERIYGPNTYTRMNKVYCAAKTFEYINGNYVVVADGGGFNSGYDEEIKEVRKYNDRIEITTLYYYHEFDFENYVRWCTDETCNTKLIEKTRDESIDESLNAFETYKDKLNSLTYTYKLAEDGFYYFVGTEVKTSGN